MTQLCELLKDVVIKLHFRLLREVLHRETGSQLVESYILLK